MATSFGYGSGRYWGDPFGGSGYYSPLSDVARLAAVSNAYSSSLPHGLTVTTPDYSSGMNESLDPGKTDLGYGPGVGVSNAGKTASALDTMFSLAAPFIGNLPSIAAKANSLIGKFGGTTLGQLAMDAVAKSTAQKGVAAFNDDAMSRGWADPFADPTAVVSPVDMSYAQQVSLSDLSSLAAVADALGLSDPSASLDAGLAASIDSLGGLGGLGGFGESNTDAQGNFGDNAYGGYAGTTSDTSDTSSSDTSSSDSSSDGSDGGSDGGDGGSDGGDGGGWARGGLASLPKRKKKQPQGGLALMSKRRRYA